MKPQLSEVVAYVGGVFLVLSFLSMFIGNLKEAGLRIALFSFAVVFSLLAGASFAFALGLVVILQVDSGPWLLWGVLLVVSVVTYKSTARLQV